MGFITTCRYLRGNLEVRLATQRNSLRKFNLRLLASPFDQGFTQFRNCRKVGALIFTGITEVARSRKFRTCDYLRLRLAGAYKSYILYM